MEKSAREEREEDLEKEKEKDQSTKKIQGNDYSWWRNPPTVYEGSMLEVFEKLLSEKGECDGTQGKSFSST